MSFDRGNCGGVIILETLNRICAVVLLRDCTDEVTYVYMRVHMYVCMYACILLCVYLYKYLYVYIYIYT